MNNHVKPINWYKKTSCFVAYKVVEGRHFLVFLHIAVSCITMCIIILIGVQ